MIGRWYWAAGIYEGEGTCYPDKRGYFRLTVGQMDSWLPMKLQSFFGGKVYEARKGFYVWCLGGEAACAFLEQVRPVLSPRRRQQFDEALRKIQIRRGRIQVKMKKQQTKRVRSEDKQTLRFVRNHQPASAPELQRALGWGHDKRLRVVQRLISEGKLRYEGNAIGRRARLVIPSHFK